MEEFISKASQKIVDRLAWCTSRRNQKGIAEDLASGKDIPEVYGLGEAGLFDEFFFFLDKFKISDLFTILTPNSFKRTSNINFHSVMLIYLMRIISGLSFFWHIQPVLLSSQPLMRLVGFNGRQIREGTSKRGVKRIDQSTDEEDNYEDDPATPIRGPIYSGSIATYIEAIPASALEIFFNALIRILAENSFFPKRVHAIMDSSEIQSTEKCEGCGVVSKQKAPELRLRKGRIRKVIEKVFGFKVWAVWDPNSKIPMAIRFTTIEVNDTKMAKAVVEQAITNLGENAKIVSIAFDRGFIDGPFMWWLDETGILFYVPSKTNMNVYKDALSLVDSGIKQVKDKKRTIGSGKNKQVVIDHYEAVGLKGLTSAGFYGEKGSGSHENRKDFIPNPINAVVVTDDPYIVNNPGAPTLVILTNDNVKKPLKIHDKYDARSEIENGLFREAKQAWFIERSPKNSASAFRAHVYLTLITMALTMLFRDWMDEQDKLSLRNKEIGIRKFREKVRQENGNKLIVFSEGFYAIFNTYEVFILCGRNVKKPRGTSEKISKEDILRKYGVLLE